MEIALNGRRPAIVLLLAVLALLAGACGHGRQAPPAVSGDPFQILLASSRDLGPVSADRPISFLLTLEDRTQSQQRADIDAIYDPRSPDYLHFRPQEEAASRFGPDPDRVARLGADLERLGLSSDWQRGYDWFRVRGPAALVESAFGVRIDDYETDAGVRFYASRKDATLPAQLRDVVTSAGRITDYPFARRLQRIAAVPENGLSPDGLVKAYDIGPLRNQQRVDGTGETVVIYATGDNFWQDDLDTFAAEYRLPPFRVKVVGPPPVKTQADARDQRKVAGELEMDIEAVHAVAPGAQIVAYTLPMSALRDVAPVYTQMVQENPHAIFNGSWGTCEANWDRASVTSLDQVLARGVQNGDSFFFSSGDQAAYECLRGHSQEVPGGQHFVVSVPYPASSAYVTSVGGTHLSVDKDGNWFNETVWEAPIETAGTGGGVSTLFPLPSWQQGRGVKNQYSNGNREIPDVSAVGDASTGMRVRSGGAWIEVAGTSLSSPIWAGITALLNQYLKKQDLHEAGFLNPALYAIANGNPRVAPFHDVVAGGNLYYPATPDYDLASGLGTPDVWNLAQDLADYERNGGR